MKDKATPASEPRYVMILPAKWIEPERQRQDQRQDLCKGWVHATSWRRHGKDLGHTRFRGGQYLPKQNVLFFISLPNTLFVLVKFGHLQQKRDAMGKAQDQCSGLKVLGCLFSEAACFLRSWLSRLPQKPLWALSAWIQGVAVGNSAIR